MIMYICHVHVRGYFCGFLSELKRLRFVLQVAGTEQGVTEPEATFSACFGGAFLMWHPMKYASMLAEKMEQHGTTAWLVNTGWTGGR